MRSHCPEVQQRHLVRRIAGANIDEEQNGSDGGLSRT
jgi:hypothetical protein